MPYESGHGPDRLRPAAVRRQVLPDRHPVPRLRRGTAVPLPVGGDRLLATAATRCWQAGVRHGRVRRRSWCSSPRSPSPTSTPGGRGCSSGGERLPTTSWSPSSTSWPTGAQEQPLADAVRHRLLRHRADGRRRAAGSTSPASAPRSMRFSPRQCDLMIVAGRVVMKMMPVLQRIWLQMPEPKWCIRMGACASHRRRVRHLRRRAGDRPLHPGGRVHPRLPAAARAADPRDAWTCRRRSSGRARSTAREFADARRRYEGPTPLAPRARRRTRRSSRRATITHRRRGCGCRLNSSTATRRSRSRSADVHRGCSGIDRMPDDLDDPDTRSSAPAASRRRRSATTTRVVVAGRRELFDRAASA